MPIEVGIILQSSPGMQRPFQEYWPELLQPFDPHLFIKSLYRLWMYVIILFLTQIRMNRPTPVPGHSTKVSAEPNSKAPIVSPIEKSVKKFKKSGGFGIVDKKTLAVFACYRDSIKYSIFALLGTVIAVVS